MTNKFSTAALGLPGKLTIKVAPRIPAVARESIAWGVNCKLAARMASASPGASRSTTACVASGVTSRRLKPVPPVVKRISSSPESAQPARTSFNLARSSGKISCLVRIHSCSAITFASAGPDASGRSPRAERSETVRIPNRKLIINLIDPDFIRRAGC